MNELLNERAQTHGDFATNAAISQRIKKLFREYGHYPNADDAQLSAVHKEALDMIALKLSRILSGQANYRDHWDDIAGYAQLAALAAK